MSINKPFWHPSVASAFLLDWDGVIADTKLDFSGIRERYYGGRKALLLEEACTLPLSDRESLFKELYDMEMACAEKATAVPGALELLERLSSQQIPFAIVSRNCGDSIEAAAKNIGVKLPKYVWHRDNSTYLKPDPRALTHAAFTLGVPTRDCVLVGDFLYDIQCARRAGIRAVLVQREEPEWNTWTDVSYPKLTDFLTALDNPEPLVPWEYRELYAKRTERWLCGAYELVLNLPDSTSPTLDCWLARAASFCVKAIYIPSDLVLTPLEWKSNSSFDPKAMGCPISEIAKDFLSVRYPMVEVATEECDGIKAPKNSLDLMRFIERKIF